MALKKSISTNIKIFQESEFGRESIDEKESVIHDCIIKVMAVEATKEEVVATVFIYSNELSIKRVYYFVPDMDGPNFIKQAYEHLKTLPDFSGAENV